MRDLKDLLGPLADDDMPDRWDAIRRRHVEPMPEPRRSRVGAFAALGAVAVLAIAVVAWLAPLGGTAPEVHKATAPDQPPAWLIEGSYQFAYANGDLAPDSAEWVLADSDTIAPAIGLQSGDPNVDRYLVVIHGDFTAYGASPPTQASLPTGHVAVAAFDADSHHITDWGVGDQEVAVQGLMPFTLPSPANLFVSGQGWSAAVPPRWNAGNFVTNWGGTGVSGESIANTDSFSATGGGDYYPQASAAGFPSNGVAIFVSPTGNLSLQQTDQLPRPPLSYDDFIKGSAPAGGSTLDSLLFQGPNGVFAATVRTGPDASPQDLDAIDAVIRSLTFAPPENP
jgi:hypothetical protein